VTSTGAITDSGILSVAGLAAFETRLNAGAAITLNSAGNNYGSVSALARNGANTANAAGAITLLEASAMNIAGLQTTSTAALTANGAITQGGVMTVGATATLNAGAGNDIELDNAANNFGTVAVSSGERDAGGRERDERRGLDGGRDAERDGQRGGGGERGGERGESVGDDG
jgi:hypothetical protein